MQQEATSNRTDVLANIFTDSRFREIRRNCWVGEVDDATVGVVLATRNPDYNNFALNKPDVERLLDGKRSGRVDEAYIVTVHISGIQRSYCGAMPAEEMWQKIEVFGLRPRTGRFGEFLCCRRDSSRMTRTCSDSSDRFATVAGGQTAGAC